jgi:DNA-binding transcriptional LysR family regulator
LENRLGGRLFHRAHTSTSEPTDLALAIKPHFERALLAWEQARHVAWEHSAANATDGAGVVSQVKRRKR